MKLPKLKLSFATGPAHTRYQNAPIARPAAGVGLNMRGPRHRLYQPAMAKGPKLKGISLTSMMPKIKPYQPTEAKWLPNPKKMAATFAPAAE